MTRPTGRRAKAWRPFLLAALVAACCAPPRPAEDPHGRLPRRSLTAALAALPLPSPDGAFVFDGVSADEGEVPTRSVRIAVEAGDFRGEPAWYVIQEVDEKRGPRLPYQTVRTTAWLAADLRVLDYRRTVDGADATHPPKDVTTTLAGALIFLRGCPAEPASYVADASDPAAPSDLSIASVAKDGTIAATASTSDSYYAHITLHGPHREVAEIDRTMGWHGMGRIVPRDVPAN